MHWVLQGNLQPDSGLRFLDDHLERWGIPYSKHDVVPFIGTIIPDISPEGNVIVIGSYSMRHVAEAKGWVPGCFDVGHLTHEDFVRNWGQRMLNADHIIRSLGEIPQWLEMHSPLHAPQSFFMRPEIDSKAFPASVYTRESFMSWLAKIIRMIETAKSREHMSIDLDTRAVLAPVRNIDQEVRCWIVDGRLVTASGYRRGDTVYYDPIVDQSILHYAREVAAHEWQPQRAYVLDLCVCEDQIRIVEVNTLNSAGFYAADMQKLVEAIEGMEFI